MASLRHTYYEFKTQRWQRLGLPEVTVPRVQIYPGRESVRFVSEHTVPRVIEDVDVTKGTFFQKYPGAASQLERPVNMRGMQYKIYWVDDIQPACMMWDMGVDLAIQLPLQELKMRIVKGIQRIYNKGGEPRWVPSKKIWRSSTGKYVSGQHNIDHPQIGGYIKRSTIHKPDLRTMHLYGLLEANVIELPMSLQVVKVPALFTATDVIARRDKGQPVTVSLLGLERAFFTSPYVWFHEFTGVKREGGRVRRPFIMQGIMQGYTQTFKAMNYGFNAVHRASEVGGKSHPKVRLLVAGTDIGNATVPSILSGGAVAAPYTRIDYEMDMYSPKERFESFYLLWWLLPPWQGWALLGGAADIQAIISGELLQARYLMPWMQALALGKFSTVIGFPLTKKYARRGLRRRLYRGRGKYRRSGGRGGGGGD